MVGAVNGRRPYPAPPLHQRPPTLVAFERQNAHLVSTSVRPCGFMRIRGEAAEPQNELQLGPDPGLTLESFVTFDAVDPRLVYEWLAESYQDESTNVTVTPRQIFRSLLLWLSLYEPRKCNLVARGDAVEKGLVPYLFGNFGDNKWQATVGIIMEDGFGILMRPPDTPIPPLPVEPEEPPPPFTLFVRSLGTNDDAARRLVAQVQAWDKANRPGMEGLRIRAYPMADGFISAANEQIVKKRWHQFVIDYPDHETGLMK